MATLSKPSYLLPFLILYLFLRPSLSKKSTFIVHMSHSHMPNAFASAHDWYSSILHSLSSNTTTTKETQQDILYTYSHSATGFAAHITASLASKLRHHPSVLSVIHDQIVEPATTLSPSFMDLSDGSGIWPVTNYGSGIIIGVVDSGIRPDIPSFDDINLKPVNWKGICETAPDFPASACNNKLIGARTFYKGYEAQFGPIQTIKSPRDYNGHGTHCASTAGGLPADNVGYYQYAVGQARGVAPLAHIAAYKVFWGTPLQSSSADILKAMDQAIEDGVHVLSMSLGNSQTYSNDPVAIGAFHAMERGVVVSAAAGNTGPDYFTVNNVAPWILTVGASTINREFSADVMLTNGEVITGSTLSDCPFQVPTAYLTLVTGEYSGSKFCNLGELDNSKVSGKMVVCESGDGTSAVFQSYAVNQAGGLAMILINKAKEGDELIANPFFIPAVTVTYSNLNIIKRYISSASKPTARINFRGTVISPSPSAPRVAAFSSRGPNPITPEILKPDVIAPGVNILAGWTDAVGPSGLDIDNRKVQYNIISGTSMACPHVSGLAALLRKNYPTWSPAAIKSAIMTTAYNLDKAGNNIIDLSTGKRSSPFLHGSGHISPDTALDPGLVYDLDTSDYVSFLCFTGNDPRIFVQSTPVVDCRTMIYSNPGNLNVPSFSVVFKSVDDVVTYKRVVKNVGPSPNAEYSVTVLTQPSYVRVKVSPPKLVFDASQQTQSYTITFTSVVGFDIPADMLVTFMTYGSIEWSDGSHRVRSPIAAYWPYQSTQQNGFVATSNLTSSVKHRVKNPIAANLQDYMPSNITTTLAIE